MKTRTLLAAALLLTLTSFAQNTGKWITSNPGENVTIYGQAISSDGYVYQCGAYYMTSVGNFTYLSKSDTLGNIIWEKYIDSTFTPGLEIAADQNSIYLVCYQNVFRFSDDGNLLWRKFIQEQAPVYVNDVLITNDGGCAIAGMHHVSASPKKGSYIVRLDSTGTVLWNKKISWSGYNSSFFYSLAQDNSNNIYACGGAGTSYTPMDAGIVVKFGPTGSIIWTRDIYGDTNTLMAFYECDFYNNELVAAGAAFPSPGVPFTFMRLDTNGINPLVALGTLNLDSSALYSFNAIHCTPYNTVIATGYKVNGSTTEGVIVELDYNFNFIRGLTNTSCGQLNGIDMTSTGTFISGTTYSGGLYGYRGISDYSWNFGCGFSSLATSLTPLMFNISFPNDSSGNVTVLDRSATAIPFTRQYTTCDNLAGITPPLTSDFSVFPNPADALLTITFSEILSESQQITILNALGEIVYVQACPAGHTVFQISTSRLAPGSYVIRTESSPGVPLVISH